MTVAELRAALEAYPDDMPVAVRTMPVPGATVEDCYGVGVDDLSVRDVVHEGEHDGVLDSDDDDPEAEDDRETTPTLIINDFAEVVGL